MLTVPILSEKKAFYKRLDNAFKKIYPEGFPSGTFTST